MICRYRHCALLAVLLLSATVAAAEEETDVRGGFFEGRMEAGFFDEAQPSKKGKVDRARKQGSNATRASDKKAHEQNPNEQKAEAANNAASQWSVPASASAKAASQAAAQPNGNQPNAAQPSAAQPNAAQSSAAQAAARADAAAASQPRSGLRFEAGSDDEGDSSYKEEVLRRAMKDTAGDASVLRVLEQTRALKERLSGVKSTDGDAPPSAEELRKTMQAVGQAVDGAGQDPQKKKPTRTASESYRLAPPISERGTKRTSQPAPETASTESPRPRTRPVTRDSLTASLVTKEQRRFAPPDVLSLVVSGQDIEHVMRHVKKLAWMKQHRQVHIGDVYIHGLHELKRMVDKVSAPGKGPQGAVSAKQKAEMYALLKSTHPLMPYAAELSSIGLPQQDMVPSEDVVQRLGLKASPVWIVRHKGRDYVFEGFSDPTSLFNANGEFIRGDE